MDSDKILIMIALVILLTAFVFRGTIVDEFQLIKQDEATELSQNLVLVYFYPLTQQERIDVIKEHVVKMNSIQERVSRSILAKYYIDYGQRILELQQEIEEKQRDLKPEDDFISFSTFGLSNIIASSQFSEEQLLQLASLIDETFPDDDETALYVLDIEENRIALEMSPFEDFNPNKKKKYQEFVNQLSREIFDGEPVFLRIGTLDSDTGEFFESIGKI